MEVELKQNMHKTWLYLKFESTEQNRIDFRKTTVSCCWVQESPPEFAESDLLLNEVQPGLARSWFIVNTLFMRLGQNCRKLGSCELLGLEGEDVIMHLISSLMQKQCIEGEAKNSQFGQFGGKINPHVRLVESVFDSIASLNQSSVLSINEFGSE